MSVGLLLVSVLLWAASLASAAPLPVVMRNGSAHVEASALEREAGIVVKRLPGPGGYVACGAQRCAPLKSAVADGQTLLVPLEALAEAMNLTAHFDEKREHVTLELGAPKAGDSTGPARVGTLVPNLRLTTLEGRTVWLQDLRGQRVLINSWASW